MKLSLSFILCFVVLSSCQSFNKSKNTRTQNSRVEKTTLAAKSNSKNISDKQWLSRANIYQELTGEKINSQQTGQKLIKMAELAQAEKNYILALKRYNTVISTFPKSKLAQAALLGKANLYKKMGLEQQAQYNHKLAMETALMSARPTKIKNQKVSVQKNNKLPARKMAADQKTGTKK